MSWVPPAPPAEGPLEERWASGPTAAPAPLGAPPSRRAGSWQGDGASAVSTPALVHFDFQTQEFSQSSLPICGPILSKRPRSVPLGISERLDCSGDVSSAAEPRAHLFLGSLGWRPSRIGGGWGQGAQAAVSRLLGPADAGCSGSEGAVRSRIPTEGPGFVRIICLYSPTQLSNLSGVTLLLPFKMPA